MYNFFSCFFKWVKNLMILFLLVILSMFSGITNYPLHVITSKTNLSTTLLQIIFTFVVATIIISIVYRYANNGKISNLLHIKISILTLLILIILSSALVISSVSGSLHSSVYDKIYALTGFKSLPVFMLYILVRCCLGPILEELCMRGLLFDFIKNKTSSESVSLIVSSIVFALGHNLFSISSIIYYLTSGFIFGIARIKSKGIIAPMITHAISNAAGYAIIFLI